MVGWIIIIIMSIIIILSIIIIIIVIIVVVVAMIGHLESLHGGLVQGGLSVEEHHIA